MLIRTLRTLWLFVMGNSWFEPWVACPIIAAEAQFRFCIRPVSIADDKEAKKEVRPPHSEVHPFSVPVQGALPASAIERHPVVNRGRPSSRSDSRQLGDGDPLLSIGERIRRDILVSERAPYGEQIVDALSRQLSEEYGRGFSRPNLFHMIRFAEGFPDRKIVYALSRQLSWTHLRQIIYLDDPLQREFYTQMCRIEGWSTRTLQDKIQGLLYERTAISRKPRHLVWKELAPLRDEDRVSPDLIFRDPYLLDFLGLKDTYSEKDLEAAILRGPGAILA